MSEDCPHCVFEKTEANCRGCFEGSHYKPKPITNADRIRSMSDEELATWLNTMQSNAWHSGRMQKRRTSTQARIKHGSTG